MFDFIPINHIKKCCDVLRASVLILQVISVLPHIHGEQSRLAVSKGQISVGGLGHLEAAVVEHQPGPATTELGGAGSFEGFDELLEAAKVKKGSGEPNRTKVASVTWDQIKKIAEDKMVDLNAFTVESAMKMVAGTARSMGLNVKGQSPF